MQERRNQNNNIKDALHSAEHVRMPTRINHKNNDGYVALVLIIFFTISVALLGTTSRALLGLVSTARQSQSRNARNAAEAGISEVINSLNTTYAHLLVVDSDRWDDPPLFSVYALIQLMGFLKQVDLYLIIRVLN